MNITKLCYRIKQITFNGQPFVGVFDQSRRSNRRSKVEIGFNDELKLEENLRKEMSSVFFNPKKCRTSMWLSYTLPNCKLILSDMVVLGKSFSEQLKEPICREYYRTFKGVMYWFEKNLDKIRN